MLFFRKQRWKFLLALICAFCFHLNTQAQHQIKVSIAGIEEGEVYFGFYYGKVKSYLDTVALANGEVMFEGEKNLVNGLYFVQTPRGGFEILVTQPQFSVAVEAPDFINTMEVKGSEQCQAFNRLQREIMKNQKVYTELGKKMQKARGDQAKVEQIGREMEVLNKAINDYQMAMVEKYKGTFLAKMISMMTRPELPEDAPKDEKGNVLGSYQRQFFTEHFFDNIDFSEPSLLMTPIYQARLDEYIDQMTMRHPDSAIVAVDRLLEKSSVSRPFYRYTLTALTGKFETLRQPWGNIVFDYLAKEYFLAGKADWMDDRLKYMLNAKVTTAAPKNRIGAEAPNIAAKDTAGNAIALEKLDGEYIVLYFYDPDCGHCKRMTPVLKSVYETYRQKGMQVMAVNVGNDEKRWKEYINEKSLNWVNVITGEKAGDVIQDYHIMSTPSVYVLDSEKKILANYLKVPEVEAYLKQEMGE